MRIDYINTLEAEEYNKLRASVGWYECNPERARTALERSDFLIAAKGEDGRTVGMARVMCDGLQALIMDVIVKPEYQGLGIGKAMMNRVMEYLVDLSQGGIIKVNLMTASDKAGFYEQFGFVERPNERLGPGMSLWLGEE